MSRAGGALGAGWLAAVVGRGSRVSGRAGASVRAGGPAVCAGAGGAGRGGPGQTRARAGRVPGRGCRSGPWVGAGSRAGGCSPLVSGSGGPGGRSGAERVPVPQGREGRRPLPGACGGDTTTGSGPEQDRGAAGLGGTGPGSRGGCGCGERGCGGWGLNTAATTENKELVLVCDGPVSTLCNRNGAIIKCNPMQ